MSNEHKEGKRATARITQLIQQKDCSALQDCASNLEAKIDPNGGGTYIQCCSTCSSQRTNNNNGRSGKGEDTHSSRCDETKENNESPTVIKRGDLILSCPALSIALDGIHRKQRCGYCTIKLSKKDSPSSSQFATTPSPSTCDSKKKSSSPSSFYCQHCHLISICEKCQQQNIHKWHIESGECRILSCLVYACNNIQQSIMGGNGNANDNDDEQNESRTLDLETTEEMANEVDSLYLLTVRVILRQWLDGEEKLISPFPKISWELFDHLYSAENPESTTVASIEDSNNLVNEICRLIFNRWSFLQDSNDQINGKNMQKQSKWFITGTKFESVMNKILGCSHAITDVHEPLGCQSIGRTLFLQHSFYNHCCIPNAFISCLNPLDDDDDDGENHICGLIGRLYCLSDIHRNDAVTISYIPTSGLDCKERRQKLQKNYNFHCNCDACKHSNDTNHPLGKLEEKLKIPDGCDVEIVRQMQFICNEQLLDIQRDLNLSNENNENEEDDEDDDAMFRLQNCIQTILMNQRGIKNQCIPQFHEVSIESYRLLAFAMSLGKNHDEAIKHYSHFMNAVTDIKDIYDPVTWATCLVDFACISKESTLHQSISSGHLSKALEIARTALGDDHSFVKSIFIRHHKYTFNGESYPKEKKRRI